MLISSGLECLYEGRNIFADFQNFENVTHYRLGSVDRNYVLPESDTMLELECTNCNCTLISGNSSFSQMIKMLGIIFAVLFGLCVFEQLILYSCKKCSKAKLY